jgi:hypothetical protein
VLAAPSLHSLGKHFLKKGSVDFSKIATLIKKGGMPGGVGGIRAAASQAAHMAPKAVVGNAVKAAPKPYVPKPGFGAGPKEMTF